MSAATSSPLLNEPKVIPGSPRPHGNFDLEERAHDAVIPAESLYWSLVEFPALQPRRSRRTPASTPCPPGILAEFAQDCPCPAENLHAVHVPLGEARTLVCGIERDGLARFIEGLPAGRSTLALRPASIPRFVRESARSTSSGGSESSLSDLRPEGLNLLVGAFEPAPLRRARSTRHLLRIAFLVLLSLGVALGLWRRAAQWDGTASATLARTRGELERVSIAPHLRAADLDALVSGLRQASQAAGGLPAPSDASLVLAEVLRDWPVSLGSRVQSVEVAEQGLTVALTVEGDPAPLIGTFRAPVGFMLEEPRVNRQQGQARITLHARHAKPAQPASALPAPRSSGGRP